MTPPLLLVPADPLAPRSPDPHFAREAEAALVLGWRVGAIDHDMLLAGDAGAAVRRVPSAAAEATMVAWYRGWMIPVEAYERFTAALATRGVQVATNSDAYRQAHELPGWYGQFAGRTPASAWLPWKAGRTPSRTDVAALTAPLGSGPGVVKDYVKSRKHEWHEACFVPDLADVAAVTRTVARLVELQGSDLAGGIVARRFESFATDEAGRAREARVWWVAGSPVLVTAHPDTPSTTVRVPETVLDDIAGCLRRISAPFVTTDLAQRNDGVWRVIEVGDGQVSDLPASEEPGTILRILTQAEQPRDTTG
ncbi:ATP-grasp domain-containing protein [Myceligenerans pegani]|uniref:ATP-grasp domain-containing protein n=1 Tax=Myceligenerans pegani TaxID=2776917 RepID=A0ABR9N385_9MICO|nr:ATP-grasp domain-containing protein [Myceligenerans sp. TRM 65318]MBE1877477.1 ATP-grasp domain-containing protein [Myceligenerans sp. TRM 65318]MBE3019748.1 ATP-grasp domain-containing protein [Myceligenerans sp. TRM 65318]